MFTLSLYSFITIVAYSLTPNGCNFIVSSLFVSKQYLCLVYFPFPLIFLSGFGHSVTLKHLFYLCVYLHIIGIDVYIVIMLFYDITQEEEGHGPMLLPL